MALIHQRCLGNDTYLSLRNYSLRTCSKFVVEESTNQRSTLTFQAIQICDPRVELMGKEGTTVGTGSTANQFCSMKHWNNVAGYLAHGISGSLS